MAKKGQSAAEHTPGELSMRTKISSFTKKGSSSRYQSLWEPVHEILGHHTLHLLHELNKTEEGRKILKEKWYDAKDNTPPKIDELLLPGAREALFNEGGQVIDGSIFKKGVSLKHGADRTWNELLATMLPIVFVAKYYPDNRDPSLAGHFLGQLTRGKDYNLKMIRNMTFNELKESIENAKPNLRVVNQLSEMEKRFGPGPMRAMDAFQNTLRNNGTSLQYEDDAEADRVNLEEEGVGAKAIANYSEKLKNGKVTRIVFNKQLVDKEIHGTM